MNIYFSQIESFTDTKFYQNSRKMSWQGCQSLKITFDADDIDCDIDEIRELLDEDGSKESKDLNL